jgi:holo-[acyl-carrier protein] synthase
MMFTLRSGIDLVEIKRLAKINPAIRQRFLQRVFTPLELVDACDSNIHLAGRFAAKEAAAKALGTGIGVIRWQDIEIQRGPDGEPVLHLYSNAAALAEKQGLTSWSVSISHTQTHAVAMVVACGPVET